MKTIVILGILFVSTVANASGNYTSEIKKIITQGENSKGVARVCLYPKGTIEGSTPECNSSSRFCADLNTPLGNSVLSIALLAYSTKKEVYVSGLGTCDRVSNSEDIDVIVVEE